MEITSWLAIITTSRLTISIIKVSIKIEMTIDIELDKFRQLYANVQDTQNMIVTHSFATMIIRVNLYLTLFHNKNTSREPICSMMGTRINTYQSCSIKNKAQSASFLMSLYSFRQQAFTISLLVSSLQRL